jgi:hypothetical protein
MILPVSCNPLPSHLFFPLPHVYSFLPIYSFNLSFVCPSFLSYISLLFKQFYTLDSLPWFLTPKSPFWFKKKILGWSMPCTMKHTFPSHPNKGAINSSPEVKPRWLMKLCPCLRGYPLTLLTTCSIVPLNYVLFGEVMCLHDDAWFYDIACVGSLKWVLVYYGSSTYNDISCLVGFFFFCVSHILVISLSLYLIKWRTS